MFLSYLFVRNCLHSLKNNFCATHLLIKIFRGSPNFNLCSLGTWAGFSKRSLGFCRPNTSLLCYCCCCRHIQHCSQSHYPFLTTHYELLSTHYSQLVDNDSILNTHNLLVTTYKSYQTDPPSSMPTCNANFVCMVQVPLAFWGIAMLPPRCCLFDVQIALA